MNDTIVTPAKPDAVAQTQPATPVVPAEVVPLTDVLRQIGRDSVDDPRRFLEETRVPFGGE